MFLTIVGVASSAIGFFALFFPSVMISEVKQASADGVGPVMASTAGILILGVGILNLLVRADPDSKTMRSVLVFNLFVQIGILPIDPLAYVTGRYTALNAFLPNTILHIFLICGFIYFLRTMPRPRYPS